MRGGASGFAQEISVGPHRLPADEPTSDQRARLLEIANKCPVHRTLTSEIDIRTRLI